VEELSFPLSNKVWERCEIMPLFYSIPIASLLPSSDVRALSFLVFAAAGNLWGCLRPGRASGVPTWKTACASVASSLVVEELPYNATSSVTASATSLAKTAADCCWRQPAAAVVRHPQTKESQARQITHKLAFRLRAFGIAVKPASHEGNHTGRMGWWWWLQAKG
jgi:hypothetical protein